MPIASRTRSARRLHNFRDTIDFESIESTAAVSTRTRSKMAVKAAADEAAKTFYDLPPELIVMIGERLEPSDLSRFHFTCRYVREACDKLFYETFFKNRHHLITKSSLETLLSITSTPHLLDKIESVHFHLASIDVAAFMRSRQEVQEQRDDFMEDQSGEDLLTDILSNVAATGKCTRLSLQRLEPFIVAPHGLRDLQDAVDDECDAGEAGKILFPREDMIRTLVDSMMRSGFRPISLSLPGIYSANSSLYDTPLELRSCLCRLETLEITECSNTHFSQAHRFDEVNVYLDQIAAASMPSLAHIILRVKGERGLDGIRQALAKLKPRKLTLFYEDRPFVVAAQFFGLVMQDHAKTLEELTIGFKILDDTPLHQMLMQWPAFSKLDVFEIAYKRKSGNVRSGDDDPEKTLRFRGKEEIDGEVQRVLALGPGI